MEPAARKQFGNPPPPPPFLPPHWMLLANHCPDFENNIALVDPTKDGIYTYDVAEQKYFHPLGYSYSRRWSNLRTQSPQRETALERKSQLFQTSPYLRRSTPQNGHARAFGGLPRNHGSDGIYSLFWLPPVNVGC